jgi:hypothetical protein
VAGLAAVGLLPHAHSTRRVLVVALIAVRRQAAASCRGCPSWPHTAQSPVDVRQQFG